MRTAPTQLYTESYLDVIKGADTIYHECTYLEADAEKAKARFHSTAAQAAQIAKLAEC
jgi:ribonuclease Z